MKLGKELCALGAALGFLAASFGILPVSAKTRLGGGY